MDTVTVDLLEPDAFHSAGGEGPTSEQDARDKARAYLRNRLELDLPAGYARLHLPDEYGRPNRRLVLMGPGPDDEQDEPEGADAPDGHDYANAAYSATRQRWESLIASGAPADEIERARAATKEAVRYAHEVARKLYGSETAGDYPACCQHTRETCGRHYKS